ncbi:hypothetical protein TNCV_3458861 [Trichonephila clavipes]|nr:hypothetical protein TNCV_3458861 [Trichonephila clavipes]
MRAARKRPSTRRYTAYGLESVFGNVTENDQMPCEPLPKIAYNILHTNPTPFPYCASKQFCIIRSEAYEFGSKGAPTFRQVKFPSPPSRRTAAPIGCRSIEESWKSSTVRNASIAARGGPDSLGGHNACAVAQLASTPCREEAPVATPHLRALTTSVCSVHAKSSGALLSISFFIRTLDRFTVHHFQAGRGGKHKRTTSVLISLGEGASMSTVFERLDTFLQLFRR